MLEMADMATVESNMKENAAQIPLFDLYLGLVAPSGRQFPCEKGLLATKCMVYKPLHSRSKTLRVARES